MIAVLLCLVSAAPMPIVVVPAPQEMDPDTKHHFVLTADTPVIVSDGAEPAAQSHLEALFETIGSRLPVLRASTCRPGTRAIYVGEPSSHPLLEKRKVRRFVPKQDMETPQGYRLDIGRDAVVVAGADPAGTFYGVQTLIQLARRSIELPCLEIRDYPDLPLRGVYATQPLSDESLHRLASYKCNLIVFDNNDFYDLSGDTGRTWRRVFETARSVHIEAVPVIHILGKAAPLLRRCPEAAEGRTCTEKIILEDDGWYTLDKRNIVNTETSPIRVRVSGHLCKDDVDYDIEPGSLAWPFESDAMPWLIRRVPGGAVPDGATVSVSYTYAPPATDACCPNAPETRALLRNVLDDMVQTLEPRYVHISHGKAHRLNECLRCRELGRTNAETFAISVQTIDGIAKEIDPDVRLMLWADAINPEQDAALHDLKPAARKLPEDVVVISRNMAQDERIRATVDWLGSLGIEHIGGAGASPSNVCAWCNALAGAETAGMGLLYMGPEITGDGFKIAMEKAWSAEMPRSAWAEALNGYFETDLWCPTYARVIDALCSHVNRRTLAGVDPETQQEKFHDFARQARKSIPEEKSEIDRTEWIHDKLCRYLRLEAAYARDRELSVLRKLVDLVEDYAQYDPETDETRVERIVETIESKWLFVPSTILFRRHLLPYRDIELQPGHTVLEIPAKPVFNDTAHRVRATYDFIQPTPPICRVDFETVGCARLEIQLSDDGESFTSAGAWTSEARGGVIGPVMLEPPVSARFVRIEANAPAERAVLRSTRIFAIKPPQRAYCPYAENVPAPGTRFDAVDWPDKGLVRGFVKPGRQLFARAQTTVRLARSRDCFFVGLSAAESRIETMVVEKPDGHGIPAESADILVQPAGGGAVFRFSFNPAGDQCDSCDWDSGWDGLWYVTTDIGESAWNAVVRIPFDTLGVTPGHGDVWRIDFVRRRRNVVDENSAWSLTNIRNAGTRAATGTSTRPDSFGTLIFE